MRPARGSLGQGRPCSVSPLPERPGPGSWPFFGMAQAGPSGPPAVTDPLQKEEEERKATQKTSDFYRIDPNLPSRFNHPGWFRGYRVKERNPLFRTTTMDYGGKPPTVHEMPMSYHVTPHVFSDTNVKFGMYRNHGINTFMEKSAVTGPDNFITFFDTYNFHPSYRTGGPSFCE